MDTNTKFLKSYDAEDAKESSYNFISEVDKAHKELFSPEGYVMLEYLHQRGLSDKIIDKYKIGYCGTGYNTFFKDYPDLQNRNSRAKAHKIFFPNLENGKIPYVYAEVPIPERMESDNSGKYWKMKSIPAQLYNEHYLRDEKAPKILFVCEGIYDALSIEEAGGAAIALTGTAHSRLLKLLKKYGQRSLLILSFDSDSAGQTNQTKLEADLKKMGIKYRTHKTHVGKDYNEALQQDRSGFIDNIHKCLATVEQEMKVEYLNGTCNYYAINDFLAQVKKNRLASQISTGFSKLDTLLGGGIYPGLYILGAVSSLGKTTLLLQIADMMAFRSSQDVIFVSLEMNRFELISKSISRETMCATAELYENEGHKAAQYALSSKDILNGGKYHAYSAQSQKVLTRAINRYKAYARHLYIVDGMDDSFCLSDIVDAVKKHMTIMESRPVVIVDYLQILRPQKDNTYLTDKQAADKTVLGLKRLSRDYNIPVIGISSFSRQQYWSPVNLASYKESGAIEYSADILFGLQYAGMDYVLKENEKEHNQRVMQLQQQYKEGASRGEPINVELKILKQRTGILGSVNLKFFPKYNLFQEEGDKDNTDTIENEESEGTGMIML